MPASLHPAITRYLRWQDQHRALLGKLLLRHAWISAGRDPKSLAELATDANRRPFLPGPQDFNLSHSGELIACAWVASGRVGVDVESIQQNLALNHFQSVFSPEQWRDIQAAPDPQRRFYTYWTAKEAVIKADGRGLGVSLPELTVEQGWAEVDGQRWHLVPLDLDPEYAAHLATPWPAPEIQREWVDFAPLPGP